MKTDKVKVAFLVPYPLRLAPSQRFRVELFLPELDIASIDYNVQVEAGNKIYCVADGNLFYLT